MLIHIGSGSFVKRLFCKLRNMKASRRRHNFSVCACGLALRLCVWSCSSSVRVVLLFVCACGLALRLCMWPCCTLVRVALLHACACVERRVVFYSVLSSLLLDEVWRINETKTNTKTKTTKINYTKCRCRRRIGRCQYYRASKASFECITAIRMENAPS
jgi:hypothetical protein